MTTGRRSFLSSAVAWAAAVVASLWPRRALSSPRGAFTRPTGAADPRTFSCYREPDGDPALRETVKLFEDAGVLLDQMHAHLSVTGHSVLCADDPRARQVGFSTWDDTPGAPDRRILWMTGTRGVQSLADRMRADWRQMPVSFGPSAARDPESVAGQDAVSLLCELLSDTRGRVRLARAYWLGAQERFKRNLGALPT